VVVAGVFASVAVLLAFVGASVPVHFRALAPSVLIEAGRGTESLDGLITDRLDAGEPGPASLLLVALEREGSKGIYQDRVDQLLKRHPTYRYSGGPDPYFEKFLAMIGQSVTVSDPGDSISLLLPAPNRRHLLGFLERSSSATVQAVLDTRRVSGMTRFSPVDSAAGHPLEAAILLTALLAQGNHFDPGVARVLKRIAEDSVEQGGPVIEKLEEMYFSVLSLGMRMNWKQLVRITALLKDPETLIFCAAVARIEEEHWPLFYSVALLSKSPSAVIRYLGRFPDRGWENLDFALQANGGALEELIKMEKPLYVPPRFLREIDSVLEPLRWTPLLRFSHRHRGVAIALKIAAFLFAGYALALFYTARQISVWHPVVIVKDSFIALFAALSIWVIVEPALFQSGPEAKARLRLDFTTGNNLESLRSQNMEITMLDQITLVIIGLFFLLQLIVYAFGMIKITELKKDSVSPALKLKLLENEENLFDLGLYVGLGGTVSSLILLAMDVVQASLIAAYSSTLFGIIFVAVLKVLNLRPFRRRLILEVELDSDEPVVAADN